MCLVTDIPRVFLFSFIFSVSPIPSLFFPRFFSLPLPLSFLVRLFLVRNDDRR